MIYLDNKHRRPQNTNKNKKLHVQCMFKIGPELKI